MSESKSASRLGQSFLEFFEVHHGDKLECSGSRRSEIWAKHAPLGYHKLFTGVSNVVDDLLGLRGLGDGNEVIKIPECMHKKTLCDLHHQICLSFVDGWDNETSESHRTEPVPRTTGSDFTVDGTGAGSDRHHDHWELSSSHGVTDEENRQPDEDASNDLSDIPGDESGNDLGGDTGDDVDDLSQSMVDLMKSEIKTQASRMDTKTTDEHLSTSPSTPKNSASSLQRSYDSNSALRSSYEIYFMNSPGPRTFMTVTTFSADPSYYKDIDVNEAAVRQKIKTPFGSKGHSPACEEAGFVYAFRDNELPFMKIGCAKDLEARKAQIERDCGYLKNLSLVAAVKVKAYKQLEKIIHQDLAPHRRFFDCVCGEPRTNQGFTRHGEYFEIDDNAAVNTLQLWADFVERQPWECNPSRPGGIHLKPDWQVKILTSSIVESSETHKSHEERVKRWRKFLVIPDPEVRIRKGTSISPFTLQNSAQKDSSITGPTKFFAPEHTPSKPSRSAIADTDEVDKSVKSGLLFFGSLKRSLPSRETTDLAHERYTHHRAHTSDFDLPYRPKDGETIPDDTAATTTSIEQAKSASNRATVLSTGRTSSPVVPPVCETQKDASGSREKVHDEVLSAVKDLPSGQVLTATTVVEKPPTGPGSFSKIQFPSIWRPHSGDNTAPSASSAPSDRTTGIKRSNDVVVPASTGDLGNIHQSHKAAQPSGMDFPPSRKIPENATTVDVSPLLRSITESATCLLAREVRPLPARAISADIWQFRWPLACSIAFALHSPHIPAGLSFLMWSIFLPFFVAELRGWTVAGHAWP